MKNQNTKQDKSKEKKLNFEKHPIQSVKNSKKKCSTAKSFIDNPVHKHKVIKAKAHIEISNALVKLRRHSKLTKKEIAKKLCIKKSEFIKIENGKNIPIYTLIKIADICDADINIEVVFPKF